MKNTKVKIHSIKYNFLMNVILKMSAFIFPLITFPYVSRVLGAGPNGDISFASSVVSYFSLVASLGIPSYGIRKCAEVRDNPQILSKTVQELLFINIICTLISYSVFIILLFTVKEFEEQKLLFLITSISILFNTLGIDWFYQAIEQYDYITVRNLIFKVLAVVLMFLFVHRPEDYIIYAGITVIGSVGSNILNIIKLGSYVSFQRFQQYHLAQHLKPIFILFLYNATTTIFTNLDQVMLGFMTNSKEVGYYAATVKIKNILVSVITALGSVMLPRVAYYLKKGNNEKFVYLIKKSFDFILITSIPIACYFIIESRAIILFLAGNGYEESIFIMQCIAPSIIFIGLSSVTAWQILIPLKKEKYTVLGAVVGAVVNLAINFVLIPSMGGSGAAIATGIAELAVLITHLIVLRKNIYRMIDKKEAIIAILGGACAIFGLYAFNHLITINIPLINCIITAVIYFGIYIIFILKLRESIVTDFVENLKNKMR